MTRADALAELIAKADAGDENRFAHSFLDEVRAWRSPLEYFEVCNQVHAAYHGSLDAAKALHEAVLPGWEVEISTRDEIDCAVLDPADPEGLTWFVGKSLESIARAWLLAVLRALAQQEGAKG